MWLLDKGVAYVRPDACDYIRYVSFLSKCKTIRLIEAAAQTLVVSILGAICKA